MEINDKSRTIATDKSRTIATDKSRTIATDKSRTIATDKSRTIATDKSTIYGVAERAEVSIATVSRVLRGSATVSPATRSRVLQAATELRYVPSAAASQLASSRQATLGLVLPHIDGAYYAELIVGFEAEAGLLNHSVSLVLANPRADASLAVRELAERVSGLAFMARSSANDQLVAELVGPRRVVTVARPVVAGAPALRVANFDSSRTLTGHLIAEGRHRLCYLGTPEPGSDVAERLAGFHQAHDDHGLENSMVLNCALDEEAGRIAVEQALNESPDLDGFVCGNDLVALSVLAALRARGRQVPDDCAVIGWDDILTARHLTPGLTTVRQPVHELGRRAARMLVEDGSTVSSEAEIVLPSEIVHRGTCCTHPQLSI